MEDHQIAWQALVPMEFAHLQDIVVLNRGQWAKESFSLKQISATSASPEAHKARMNAKRKSGKPSLELRLNGTKPVKQVRSH
jgi:hypothetical protein